MRLRPARPDERAALEDLQRRASLVWDDYREALSAHPEAIELPAEQIAAGQVIVAERDGVTLGFTVVLPRADDGAELDGLFVEPDHWRSGVGRRLVDAAVAAAREGGAATLHVIANPRALSFYEAVGFERLGETPTRFGPAIAMRKALRPFAAAPVATTCAP